jgi:hypothetical protein
MFKYTSQMGRPTGQAGWPCNDPFIKRVYQVNYFMTQTLLSLTLTL